MIRNWFHSYFERENFQVKEFAYNEASIDGQKGHCGENLTRLEHRLILRNCQKGFNQFDKFCIKT